MNCQRGPTFFLTRGVRGGGGGGIQFRKGRGGPLQTRTRRPRSYNSIRMDSSRDIPMCHSSVATINNNADLHVHSQPCGLGTRLDDTHMKFRGGYRKSGRGGGGSDMNNQ